MLLNRKTREGIVAGTITLQFRRWKKPTVKSGGTLLTASGQMAIDDVREVDVAAITDRDAVAAGFADRAALVNELDRRGSDAPVYRVALRHAGDDPRIALRAALPDAEEHDALRKRLARWDAASPVGPWTHAVLELIERRPAERAAELADELDMPKDRLKQNVRKLKGLGLTESLEVGYRLSPRGTAVLDGLRER